MAPLNTYYSHKISLFSKIGRSTNPVDLTHSQNIKTNCTQVDDIHGQGKAN